MAQSGIPVKNVNPDLWGGGVCYANLERFKVCFSRKTGEGGSGKAIRKISRLYCFFSIEGFLKWFYTNSIALMNTTLACCPFTSEFNFISFYWLFKNIEIKWELRLIIHSTKLGEGIHVQCASYPS